jgi:hypothetical protein
MVPAENVARALGIKGEVGSITDLRRRIGRGLPQRARSCCQRPTFHEIRGLGPRLCRVRGISERAIQALMTHAKRRLEVAMAHLPLRCARRSPGRRHSDRLGHRARRRAGPSARGRRACWRFERTLVRIEMRVGKNKGPREQVTSIGTE